MPFSLLIEARDVADLLGLSFLDAIRLIREMEDLKPCVIVEV